MSKAAYIKSVKVKDSNELILGIESRSKDGASTGYTIDPAATGGRKSVFLTSYSMDNATTNFIFPAIAQAVRRGESIIAVDDGWLHNNISLFLYEHGYRIVTFNTKEPYKTEFCYDPFSTFAPGVDDAEATDAITRFARATTFNLPIDPKKRNRDEVLTAKTLAYYILRLRLETYHAGTCSREELIRDNEFFLDSARIPDKGLGDEVRNHISTSPKWLVNYASSMVEQIIAPALGSSNIAAPLYSEANTKPCRFMDRTFYDISSFTEEKTAIFITAPYKMYSGTHPAPIELFTNLVNVLIASAKKNGGALKMPVSMYLVQLTNLGRIPGIESLLKTFDAIGVQTLLYQMDPEGAHIIYGDENFQKMLTSCACCVTFDKDDLQTGIFCEAANARLQRGDVGGISGLTRLGDNRSFILPMFDGNLPIVAPMQPQINDFEFFDEFMADSIINQVRINNGLTMEQSERDIQIGISPIAAEGMDPRSVLYEPISNTLRLQMGYGTTHLGSIKHRLDPKTHPNWETPYISTLFAVTITPAKFGETEKEEFFKNKKLSIEVYVVPDPSSKKSAFSPSFNSGDRFVAGYDFDFNEEEGGMDKYILQTKDGPTFKMKLILEDFNLLGDAYLSFEEQKNHMYSPKGKYKLEFRLSTDGEHFKTYASINVRMSAPKMDSPIIVPETQKKVFAELFNQQ